MLSTTLDMIIEGEERHPYRTAIQFVEGEIEFYKNSIERNTERIEFLKAKISDEEGKTSSRRRKRKVK